MKWQTGDRARIFGLIALQCVGLPVVALLTWPLVSQWHERDLEIYHDFALKLLQGGFPYRDFPLEYPPLALLPFALPWLLSFGQLLSPAGYMWRFLIESALFSTLIALALARIVSIGRAWWRPLTALSLYALLVLMSAPMLPWRYDLFPTLLTLLALLCALRGRPALAGLCIGFGVVAKLYPIVLLPIFGAYYFAGKSYRSLIWLALGCAGALAVVMLPFLLVDPQGWLSFVRYHQMRGLQLESLPAGAIMLARALGLARAEVVFNYGALHLASPLTDVALRWLPFAFILVFGLVCACCLARFRHERAALGAVTAPSLAASVVMALLAFIVTNKVFSAQYVIWLLPFAPLLRPRQAGALVVACALTIVIFPFTYGDLIAMRAIPVLLLNLRNALVVALLLWLLVEYLPAPVRKVTR